MYYKLDENKNVVPCTIEEWAKQRELMRIENTKHVAVDFVKSKWVSTVWLGIDHNTMTWTASKDHAPHIFETIVFDRNSHYELYTDRYSTWKEAEEGHKKAIEWVKNGCKDDERHQ